MGYKYIILHKKMSNYKKILGKIFMKKEQLDEVDLKIINLLQEDASLSIMELAKHVNLSQTPCWRRIQKMEKNGILLGRHVRVNAQAVGFGLTVLVHVKTDSHTGDWLDNFRMMIKKHPEILSVYRVAGGFDYTLRVVVRDIAAYDSFYRNVIAECNFSDVMSNFVMEEIKHTDTLPL